MLKDMKAENVKINARLNALQNPTVGRAGLTNASALKTPTPPPKTPEPKVITKNSNTPSYAQKAAAQPKTPILAQRASELTTNSPRSKSNSSNDKKDLRFVLRIHGTVPVDKRATPNQMKEAIDAALSRRSGTSSTKLREAKWNASGNIILTFPHNANAQAILNSEDTIKRALNIPAPASMSRDSSWSKPLLTNVWTSINPYTGYGTPYSEDYLLNQLLDNNVHAKKLEITQKPRWVTRPELLKKERSSIVFAFADPDGSLINKLLKERWYMCGSQVTPKRWNDKPVLKVCHRCLSYDRNTPGYRNTVRCGRCGDNHGTEQHREKCRKCKNDNIDKELPCKHEPKCAACNGAHPFDHSECPELRKYRPNVTTILITNAENSMQA